MSKAAQLQAKAANLPEPVAAEVLDFLEFLTTRRREEFPQPVDKIRQLRGAFKGRLSSSDEFSAQKANDIRLEK